MPLPQLLLPGVASYLRSAWNLLFYASLTEYKALQRQDYNGVV